MASDATTNPFHFKRISTILLFSALSGKYKRGKSSSRLIWSLIALLKYQTIDKWLHLRKGKYHLDSNLLDRVITLYKITKEQPFQIV